MLSMVPVKPMAPKTPTPPVQKIETWATFHHFGSRAGTPKLVEYGIAHRISGVPSKHARLIARIIETRP